MKIKFSVIFLLLFVLTVLSANAGEEKDKLVLGHRGACGYLPEHTLPCYALAYGMGADYIEPDLVLTKDGVFVCVHDIYLDDTTSVEELFPERCREDGHWYAIDFTLEEIKSLSVHERANSDGTPVFSGRFPLYQSKFEIATFEEMIQLIQGLNKSTGRNVGIIPELKHPSFHAGEGQPVEEKFLEIVDKYGYLDANAKIYVQCFEVEPLKKLKDLQPDLPLLQLVGEPEWEYKDEIPYTDELTEENIAEIATYADVLSPDKSRIEKNPSLVEWAHNAGMEVQPYTFRADALPEKYETFEEELYQFYFVYNVDGLFTDFPDRASLMLAHKDCR